MKVLKNAVKKIKNVADDWVEALYFAYFKNDHESILRAQIPPRRLRRIVGSSSMLIYLQVGQEFFLYLKLLVGLKPEHKVLDVGCGCARVGGFLAGTIKSPGCYDGFDVVPELIENAKKRLTPFNPLFNFKTIRLYNKLYNPSPNDPKDSDLVFPYPDDRYDIVYLASVFTHLLPPGLKNYVEQISRVTKSGGKCLATFFLLENLPEAGDEWKISDLKKNLAIMPNEMDSSYFKISNQDIPECLVAYDLAYVDRIFRENGMGRISGPHYGAWSGNSNSLSWQDILVYQKQ